MSVGNYLHMIKKIVLFANSLRQDTPRSAFIFFTRDPVRKGGELSINMNLDIKNFGMFPESGSENSGTGEDSEP